MERQHSISLNIIFQVNILCIYIFLAKIVDHYISSDLPVVKNSLSNIYVTVMSLVDTAILK